LRLLNINSWSSREDEAFLSYLIVLLVLYFVPTVVCTYYGQWFYSLSLLFALSKSLSSPSSSYIEEGERKGEKREETEREGKKRERKRMRDIEK